MLRKTLFVICAIGAIIIFLLPFNLKQEYLGERLIPHPSYHHFHKPNSSVLAKFKEPERTVRTDFDEEGLNDWPRIPGKPKVIFIGDSFLEARQVLRDDLFGNQVEENLSNIDVVNVGCAGWTAFTYYNWLRENIDKYKEVKAVYLFYYPNDPRDTIHYLKYADDPEDYENITFQKSYDDYNVPTRALRLWLKKNSKVYYSLTKIKRMINNQIEAKKGHKGLIDEKRIERFEPYVLGNLNEEMQGALDLTDMFLVKIKDYLKNRNIDFTIVYTPMSQQVDLKENKIGSERYTKEFVEKMYGSTFFQDHLAEFTSKHNLSFIDLRKELREYKDNHPDTLLYNVSDGHFSEDGHRALAEILLSGVQKFD